MTPRAAAVRGGGALRNILQKIVEYLLLMIAGVVGAVSDPDASFGSSGVTRFPSSRTRPDLIFRGGFP